MRAILEVEEIAKSFGALRAVDRVSFAVGSGEVFGVAGANGSGKSTLFNVLTGVPYAADLGRVRFKGVAIEGMAPHRIVRQGLARTFQHDAVFPSLSATQTMRLAAMHGGGGLRLAELEALLEEFGIAGERLLVPSATLSAFEKRKLAIATALATRPDALLLDEPASGLTPAETVELARLIRKMPERGITVLVIENVLWLLLEVCSRLMVLNRGRVLAIGEPAAVMRDERVVEAYLGRRGVRARAAAGA